MARGRLAKFYRPGRWDAAAIGDEHRLLAALDREEIPVAAPLPLAGDRTLATTGEGIHFALFPRVGGRAPDDLGLLELEQLGRLVGRIHNVGAEFGLVHRPALSAATYGRDALATVMSRGRLGPSLERRYRDAAETIIARAEGRLAGVPQHPLHADFHRGNLLRGRQGFVVLDFDDAARGPVVQDLWLVLPARPPDCPEEVEAIVRGYEQFRAFDRSMLRLVEVLRALRYLRYAGWITARWDDPSFKHAFPQFGTESYWEGQIADLYEQIRVLDGGGDGG